VLKKNGVFACTDARLLDAARAERLVTFDKAMSRIAASFEM